MPDAARRRSVADLDLDHQVPEADATEQRIPVLDDGTDVRELPDAMPLEADPADVTDQRQVVPLDDEDRDDPSAVSDALEETSSAGWPDLTAPGP